MVTPEQEECLAIVPFVSRAMSLSFWRLNSVSMARFGLRLYSLLDQRRHFH